MQLKRIYYKLQGSMHYDRYLMNNDLQLCVKPSSPDLLTISIVSLRKAFYH